MRKIVTLLVMLNLLPIKLEGMNEKKQERGVLGYWLFQMDNISKGSQMPSISPSNLLLKDQEEVQVFSEMPVVKLPIISNNLPKNFKGRKTYCFTCQELFLNKDLLKNHRCTAKHRDTRLMYPLKKCSIIECNFKAKTTNKMVAHSKKKHELWWCEICSESMFLVSWEHKMQHCMEEHKKNYIWGQCAFCGNKADQLKDFFVHMISTHLVSQETSNN